MPKSIEAIYEDGVLKPTGPLEIGEHTRVKITLETEPDSRQTAQHVLALARSVGS